LDFLLDFGWIIGLDWIFCWIFVGLLDWIGFFQFNPTQCSNKNPTENPKIQFWIFDIERVLIIQLFWIFGVGFGWMFNQPSNPKSRKKLTS
jgi:hypothetical protein